MDSLYIIVPAYNESENINDCIDDWYPVVQKHEADGRSRLVIVDDGSKDNTLDIIKESQKERPLLEYITKPNGGHGSAVLTGYSYAIEKCADYVFQTDSDGQTNPEEFEQFWTQRQEYDAIIGERLKRADGRDRKFVEDVVCIILKLIFGVSVRDANAPFRLMKREKLKKYIEKLPKDFYVPNIMLTTYYLKYKDAVQFINISFKPRKRGTDSINIAKITKIGVKAILDFIKLKKEI